MSTIHSPFSSGLIKSNFSSVLIVFWGFFVWIALGVVDLLSQSCWWENPTLPKSKWATWLYQRHNRSIHMTNGMTVMSLPAASLLQKISATVDRLCQITLNWKLPCKFKKWCKFQITLQQNLTKRVHMKWDLLVTYNSWCVNLWQYRKVPYIMCVIVSEILFSYPFSLFPDYQLLTPASMFFYCPNMKVKKSWMTGLWKQLTIQKGLECCSVCLALILWCFISFPPSFKPTSTLLTWWNCFVYFSKFLSFDTKCSMKKHTGIVK